WNMRVTVKRDYDSLLGISSNICVKAPIFVFAVGKNEDVLRTNIHIEMPIQRGDVHTSLLSGPSYSCIHQLTHRVSIHQIPNISLARWGERNMLRVLFCALWSQDRSNVQLTQEEQREFYE